MQDTDDDDVETPVPTLNRAQRRALARNTVNQRSLARGQWATPKRRPLR